MTADSPDSDAHTFFDRVVAAADEKRRLPLPSMAGWETFPFEPETLRVKALEDLTLPEPLRHGEDGPGATAATAACQRCTDPEHGAVWSNERWVLVGEPESHLPFTAQLIPRLHYDLVDLPDPMAAELGVLTVRIARALEADPRIGRLHVYRIGDGGAHLHVWLLGRPAGMLQLLGSNLVLWEEMLPIIPTKEAAEFVALAVAGLADPGSHRDGVTTSQ